MAEEKKLSRAEQIERFVKANAVTQDKGVTGHARDIGLSLLSGAVSVPETAVGLADIATGGNVGKTLENQDGMFGFRPKEAKEAINSWKTERTKKQMQDFQEADGVGAKFGQALSNPSLVTNTVVESLPAMGAGGVVGRGIAAAAPRLAGVAAGALGEGAVGAGLAAEQIRQQTDDGLLTDKQAALAAATGAATAGFGYAGGRVAKKLGIGDVDTALAGGGLGASNKNIVRRTLEGAVSEGFLEELPQSVSETVLQNIALDKPIEEGVDEAAVLGLLSGGLMGGIAGAATRSAPVDTDASTNPTIDPTTGAPLGLPRPSGPTGNGGEPRGLDDINRDWFGPGRGPDSRGMRDVSPQEDIGPRDNQLPINQPRLPYNDGSLASAAAISTATDTGAPRLGFYGERKATPTPAEDMGIDASKGGLSAAAALAVNSGVSQAANTNNGVSDANTRSAADKRASELRANAPYKMDRAKAVADNETYGQDYLARQQAKNSAEVESSPTETSAIDNERLAANTAVATGKDGKAKWFGREEKAQDFIAKKNISDTHEVVSAGKSRFEIQPKAQTSEAVKPVVRNTPVKDEAKATGKSFTADNDEIPYQWDVVDAKDLVSSHSNTFGKNPDFPADAQPRDRANAGYQAQVLEIQKEFNPERLGESSLVSDGSPFVGASDNVVESGNGRTIAIRRNYESGNGEAYRQFVQDRAEKFGLDPETVSSMNEPVLVRRNLSTIDRSEFAVKANKDNKAAMGATEQARIDAKAIPDTDLIEFDSNGSMNLSNSRKFTQAFASSLGTNEAGNLIAANGEISQSGKARITGALIHNAYESDKLTQAVTETLDPSAKNVLKTLADKAPQISRLKQQVKDGKRDDSTLAKDMSAAAEKYIDLVESGANIDLYIANNNLFNEDAVSPQVADIISDFSNNARSAAKMGSALQARIDADVRAADPNAAGLFGADEAPAAPVNNKKRSIVRGKRDATANLTVATGDTSWQQTYGKTQTLIKKLVRKGHLSQSEVDSTSGEWSKQIDLAVKGINVEREANNVPAAYTGKTESTATEEAPKTLGAGKDKRTLIGNNADGQPVYEDSRGIRSMRRGAFMASEPVKLQLGNDENPFNTDNRPDEFKLDSEISKASKSYAPTNRAGLSSYLATKLNDKDGQFSQSQVEDAIRDEMNIEFDFENTAAYDAMESAKTYSDFAKEVFDKLAENKKAAPVIKDAEVIEGVPAKPKPADQAKKEKERFSNNSFTNKEEAERRIARIKSKMGTLNSGMDPEMMGDGIYVAVAFIEDGILAFKDFAKAMTETLGNDITPYLSMFWEGARRYPGFEGSDGMTSMSESDAQFKQLMLEYKPSKDMEAVLGEDKTQVKPKRKVTKPTNKEVMLRADWGVPHIDGYVESDEFKGEQTDYGISGGVKDAFLKDAKNYLTGTKKHLESLGYTMALDRKDKPMKINVNESGPATSGEVSLSMQKDGSNIHVSIGQSSVPMLSMFRDMSADGTPINNAPHPQQVAVMYRTSMNEGDTYATKQNNSSGNIWLSHRLTATELAEDINKTSDKIVERANKGVATNDRRTSNDSNSTSGEVNLSTPSSSTGTPGQTRAASNGSVASVEAVDGNSAGSNNGIVSQGQSNRQAITSNDNTVRSEPNGAGSSNGVSQPAARPRGNLNDHRVSAEDLTRQGSWYDAAENNVAVIELIQKIDSENRTATPAEQQQLSRYTGWGATEIANGIFANPMTGKYKSDRWAALGEKLKGLLSTAEYETARSTTQFAHYTPPVVVDGIYKALEQFGFAGGQVLEPASGVGVFNGLMPGSMSKNSQYTGVELDPTTGRIAQLLYPQSNMMISDYTKVKLPDNFFDVAVGNPPFANVSFDYGKGKNKQSFQLHDYFFAKTMDKVKPGGIVVFVTSTGTMDKKGDKARTWLSERADLVGAVRLPQTAFKENSGTETVTDIIFLRKRKDGEQPGGAKWGGLKTINANGQDLAVNEYYAANPSMIIGNSDHRTDQFGNLKYTVTAPAGDFGEALNTAIAQMDKNIFNPERGSKEEKAKVMQMDLGPRSAEQKEGGVYLKDGVLMRVSNGIGQPLTNRRTQKGDFTDLTKKQVAFLTDYVPLRDALKQAQRDQLEDNPNWEQSLANLNKVYDAFVAKHGPILKHSISEREVTEVETDEDGEVIDTVTTVRVQKTFTNRTALFLDAESALVRGIENIVEGEVSADGKQGVVEKGEFFKGRTLNSPKQPRIASTQDALETSLNETGALDVARVAELIGKNQQEVIEELGDQIYFDPSQDSYALVEDYLSGNVVEKLKQAKAAAKNDPDLKRNVAALEAVQPEPILPKDITANLGSAWVPTETIEQFAAEVLGVSNAKITYSAITSNWKATGRGGSLEFETNRRNSSELLDSLLNSRKIVVTYSIPGGGTAVNEVATQEANDAADKIKEAWANWVWADSSRAATLSELYNEKFNNIVPAYYGNGDHLTLDGMSSLIKLRPHQKRGIYRIIRQGDTYLNHAVGAGKTFTMIAGAMEEKRLGLINKPMFVVPNHMLDQFSQEFLMLYPAANIMVADTANFHTSNRRDFIAQASINNPDAIIITHSSFGKIGVSDKVLAKFLQEKVNEYREALQEAYAEGDSKSRSVKQIEKAMLAATQKIEKLLDSTDKDDNVFFEDMGVDRLYVDEMHEFRKLSFSTRQGNVKGITALGSQKAMDLQMKSSVIREKSPGRALVGASGTPITNTMGELFTVQRFFQPKQLEQDGLKFFDAWASQFGSTVEGLEQNTAGNYAMVSRFAKFQNMPELMSRVRSFMDVLTNYDLGSLVQRPEVVGGSRQIVVTPVPDGFVEYQKSLGERIEAIKARGGKPEPGDDIILNVIGDGRFAAIDMRFVDPTLPSDPNSKLNYAIEDLAQAYKETANKKYTSKDSNGNTVTDKLTGSSLVMFTDIGLGEQSAENRGFDMKKWIYDELVRKGVDRDHIAFISDYSSHAKKGVLFEEMRDGKKRILIGGKGMETGMNIQKRLSHLFHLDAPWFPASVEQREGRIIRQGNQNAEVFIKAFATKGSYDSTMWTLVATKARFIEQAMSGDSSMRSMDDVSEASSFEQAAALSSGDQRYVQLAMLRQKADQLDRASTAYHQRKNREQREVKDLGTRLVRYNRELVDTKAALKGYKPLSADIFQGKVGNAAFDKTPEFGEKLALDYIELNNSKFVGKKVMGSVNGYTLTYNGVDSRSGYMSDMDVDVPSSDVTPIITDVSIKDVRTTGLAARIMNRVNNMTGYVSALEAEIEAIETKIPLLEKAIARPFDKADEQAEVLSDLYDLTAELEREAEPAPSNDDESGVRTSAPKPPAVSKARTGNVDTATFVKVFGLKGIVATSGTSNTMDEKQQAILNDTYDALLQMSELLNIPSEAIGLAGELTINIKPNLQMKPFFSPIASAGPTLNMNGEPGIIAHEWFHALDNHFTSFRKGVARNTTRENSSITLLPEPQMVLDMPGIKKYRAPQGSLETILADRKATSADPTSPAFDAKNWKVDPDHPTGVRPVVEKSFAKLVDVLNKSEMKARSIKLDQQQKKGSYWSSTVELAARGFESFIKSKMVKNNADNENLVRNLRTEFESHKLGEDLYHYTTEADGPAINDAFNELFSTIESKPTADGKAQTLYSRGTSTKLAPNGKPSNLNDKQWAEVRTPAFKTWFGDWENDPANASKILDENGEPLVVYHVSDAEFTEFSNDAKGENTGFDNTSLGTFFTTSEGIDALKESNEDTFGDIEYKSYLNIKNPLDIRQEAIFGNEDTAALVYEMLQGEPADSPQDAIDFMNDEIGMGDMDEVYESINMSGDAAINAGFDGYISTLGDGHVEYISINPNQVKSAEINEGTFNPDSNDIRFSQSNPAKGSTKTTRKQIIDKLAGKFGKSVIDRLIADGTLDIKVLNDYVVDGRLTIPDDVGGIYHRGRATLIADNLTDADIIPTFIHELGGHGGLQALMTQKAYDALMRDFDALVAAGDPIALKAKRQADAVSNNQAEANDEYLAYLITYASQQKEARGGKVNSLINRIIMAVRSWLKNTLGVPIQLNSQEILALAEHLISVRANLSIPVAADMPVNAGMQFSRATGAFDPQTIARESVTRFHDWASSSPPGKLSWWHKTIGTMYNLAQRNKYFKPVFDHTEKFINDVSFYASKASEFAPRLLPKLDSLKDITKTAIGAKDNDAISKPIFEGTLLWGRDLNGKAVLIDDWRKKVMATSIQDRLQLLKDAGRITPAQEAELAKLKGIQAQRFINGIIDDEVSAGLVWTDQELRDKFNLNDDQIGLYREFRSATDNSLDSLTRSDMLRKLGKNANDIEKAVMEAGTLNDAMSVIEQHINSLSTAEPKKAQALAGTLADIKASAGRTKNLMAKGYAPLSRFGQYTVDVVDADGNREYFGMFESAYDARKMADEMIELYGEQYVTRGALSNEEFKMFAGVTPETAELFGEMLGLDATGDKAADEAFQEFLKRTKNNRSAMKRLMHRKGIKGYSEDVGRVLASFIYSNARHTSAALNMGNLDRSIADIPKAEGQLKDAAVKLAQYIKNPQEEGSVIRGWMFAQYLGGSIASAVVNLTQPIAVSFPYLSQFGGAAKAAAELTRASSDWATKRAFAPDLQKAIENAEADGTLSPQEVHNLLRQARGQNPLRAGDGTKYGDAKAALQNTGSRVGLGWGAFFSLAEQINRRVTFVAAYRMAQDQGMADPAKFASQSIKETQFVYNKASRMQWGRGAVGGTLLTFKTYSVSYIELMHRMWNQGEKGSPERAAGRKASLIMLATLFLLAGGGGMPFMEDIEDVIDGMSQVMGYNISSRKARQEFLDTVFGEMLGEFIETGITGIPGMPTDVSGRLGMDNLIPGTGVFKQRTSNTKDVLELVGPAGDFISRVGTGTRSILKGAVSGDARQVGRGALELAPVAVRNAVKGTDMMTTGIYKDTKGYKVDDVTPIDAAFKAIGFQPKDISKIQGAAWLTQTGTAYYNLRASEIRALWAAGISEGNNSKIKDAQAALADWNKKNPDQKIVIRPTDIQRRIREMNMNKSDRVTKLAPKSMREQIQSDFADARGD